MISNGMRLLDYFSLVSGCRSWPHSLTMMKRPHILEAAFLKKTWIFRNYLKDSEQITFGLAIEDIVNRNVIFYRHTALA